MSRHVWPEESLEFEMLGLISVTDTVKKTKVVMKKEHDILMTEIINLPKQASIELKNGDDNIRQAQRSCLLGHEDGHVPFKPIQIFEPSKSNKCISFHMYMIMYHACATANDILFPLKIIKKMGLRLVYI